jgi:hypothetical protein
MSRRVGSANAKNTRESGSAGTTILLVLNHSVEHNLNLPGAVVNQSVEEPAVVAATGHANVT